MTFSLAIKASATLAKMKFEYDNIILGSSLSAIMLAAQKNLPVVFSDFEPPFRFDYLPPEQDTSYFNFPEELQQKSLKTFGEDLKVGLPKQILWERLIFLLSMNGNVPLSNLCTSIRASDNKLTCSNEYSKIAEIAFNNCYYFGDNNTLGLLENKDLDSSTYICYDWIAFNKGGKHDIDFLETDDDFVKQVWFYSSDRIDGNTTVKDACIVSVLTSEQLRDFAYSETMAKFKLIAEMEKRGMKGKFNGYNSSGNPRHYKFKTKHIRREKHAEYKPRDLKIKGFHHPPARKEADLYKNLQQISMEYDRFLRGLSGNPYSYSRDHPGSES